ncbi:hypothetical protein BZM27_04465 [Paraburkholderia steynii]|uniref:Uncharacterized protein n=1 Tax=Paraburkholderia steynii TaxID=1245441 RepID=A0A4R0XS60_9BURK|nr:hypothetical protein BZM27_04465 [Paraburkholderia steynii]
MHLKARTGIQCALPRPGLGRASTRQGQAGPSAVTMERAAARKLVQATFAVQFAISPVLDRCESNADTRRANGSGVGE